MPKLYTGSRGGVYYKKKGKKVYVKQRQSNFGYLSHFGDELDDIVRTILGCIASGEKTKVIRSFIENNELKLNEELYRKLRKNVDSLDTETQKKKLRNLVKWIKLAIKAEQSGSTAKRESRRGWGVQPSESIRNKGANMTIGGVEDIKVILKKDMKSGTTKAIDMVKLAIPNVKTMFKKDIRAMGIIDEIVVDSILQLRDDIPQSSKDAAAKFKSILGSQKRENSQFDIIYDKLYPHEQEGSSYVEVPRGKELITRYRNLKEPFMTNLAIPDELKSKYRGFFMMAGIGGIDDGAIEQWFARNSIFGKSEEELEAIIKEYGVTEKTLTRRGTERFKSLSPQERHEEMMDAFEHFSAEEIDEIFEAIRKKRMMEPIAEFGRFSHFGYYY